MRISGFVSGAIGCVSKIEAIELEHTLWGFMAEFMGQSDGPHLGGSRFVYAEELLSK